MEKIEDLNKKSYDSQLKIYKALRQILITKSLNDITVTDICEECNSHKHLEECSKYVFICEECSYENHKHKEDSCKRKDLRGTSRYPVHPVH